LTDSHASPSSPFKQPRAVWAVAFACVISFMGIGLVDPILPALASDLHASPSQVSMLFTSYLVVTAVAMLIVGWVSSRIGSKPTLIVALSIIVVFSALAGASDTIGQIVGFRAGWGLGNALFISTSLAVIVASASGGFGGAVVLYESALGLGIAVGPLLGGQLGSISWRGPFFGVACLMAIALIATIFFVPSQPRPEKKTSLAAPLKALRHRGLLTMGMVALFYNWGFFTMLGYAPYPMELNASDLGFVFAAWGLLVAIFAVAGAPRLQRRFGTVPVLYGNLVGCAAVLAAIALGVDTPTVVIVAVIISGIFIGTNNTLTTQAVMLVSPVERSVASSAYGFVRFIGGGLAPFCAGKLADATNLGVPFWVGSAAFLIAIPILASGRKLVDAAEESDADETLLLPALEPVGPPAVDRGRPVVIAIGVNTDSNAVVDAGARLALETSGPLEVVRVHETTVVDESAIEYRGIDEAREAVETQLARLAAAGVPASGHILPTVGDHGTAGKALARHADEVDAVAVAVGRSTRGAVVQFAEGSFTSTLTRTAHCNVMLVDPDSEPHELNPGDLADLRYAK
jgi:MFS family permease